MLYLSSRRYAPVHGRTTHKPSQWSFPVVGAPSPPCRPHHLWKSGQEGGTCGDVGHGGVPISSVGNRRLQVSNVKWPLGSSSEKPRNSKVPLDLGIVPLTRRTVPSSCASGKHRQRYRSREGGWKAMDVGLNVGRPTAAKTRGSRKWVPMQLRSHLGIYRIGCRAYLIGPRLCVFLPLAPAVFAFHFNTSTSVRPSSSPPFSPPSSHHHLFINIYQTPFASSKGKKNNATQLRYHATWGGSHSLLGPHQHVRLQVTHWTPHTT